MVSFVAFSYGEGRKILGILDLPEMIAMHTPLHPIAPPARWNI